jgi:hypothetical protein
MNSQPLPRTALIAIATTIVAACAGAMAQAEGPVPLPAEVTARGETIYYGSVYPVDDAGEAPLFVYERRTGEQQGTPVSTHITRDRSGAVVFADAATHARDYALVDYTLYGNQLGQRGSIHVGEHEVTFTLVDGRGERQRRETRKGPVAVGPTLVGYIFHNLDALSAGRTVPVRFALLDRLETIAFDLQAVDAAPGRTRIRMKPSSLLLSALVRPLYFTFDAAGKLVQLEGRMPTKQPRGDRLRDLDARVEYRYVAAAYR